VSLFRLVAILFIYCCTAVAWAVLGTSVVQRTGEFDQRLEQEVAALWGGRHNQVAPDASLERPRAVTELVSGQPVVKTIFDELPLPLDSSRVNVELHLDQRRKGLLWYNTYAAIFKGRYTLHNPDDAARGVLVHVAFPSTDALYDGFSFRVNGKEEEAVRELSKGINVRVPLAPRGEGVIDLTYRTRGLGQWTYSFGPQGISHVRDFQLDMKTDFRGIDFPAGSLSPDLKTAEGAGYHLAWKFESLVSGQHIALEPPNRINPGPLAARITFFAPVSLLFFMTVLVMLGALRGHDLHPMNYFFLAAAFFSFHLLLAYLVDHLSIHTSFAVAAGTSLLLVVSYLRLVGGIRFALLEAGVAQLVFLVLFSYAFFFEGYTGLTVTVGAVLTLFVLMQITARVDWEQVLPLRRPANPSRH
jgi:hypothetical protein